MGCMGTPANTMFTGGAGGHVLRERSEHHIPSPGAQLLQGAW